MALRTAASSSKLASNIKPLANQSKKIPEHLNVKAAAPNLSLKAAPLSAPSHAQPEDEDEDDGQEDSEIEEGANEDLTLEDVIALGGDKV